MQWSVALCLVACGDTLSLNVARGTSIMCDTKPPSSWSTVEQGELDFTLLREWVGQALQTPGTSIAEMAGVLSIYCADEKFVLRGAHMHGTDVHIDGEFVDPWSAGEDRESKLVFLGTNLDHAALAKGLRGCVVSPMVLEVKKQGLRFAVGDTVECRTQSGWIKGDVVDLLYRDDSMPPGLVAPYRVHLEESGSLIFAPEDSDEVIRSKRLERLRFAVDDAVECNVGDGWAKGKVVDLQFKEPGMPPGMVAPYQVELEDDGGLIYAPNDSNEVIRKPWRFFDAAPFGG